MSIIHKLAVCAAAAAFIATFSGCSSTRPHLSYLSGLEGTQGSLSSGDYAVRVVPADELEIVVTSTVPTATAEFNLPASNAQYTSGQSSILTTNEQQKYVVDKKGDIDFPVLGTLHVAGLTTMQIKEMITDSVSRMVEDPKVKVRLANFRVNVMGEVRSPRTIDVRSERFTIFDALAGAGDMTEYGRRDNVTVIREEGDSLVYARLDLRDPAVVSSPFYYLKQNDVVIVDPNEVRQANSKYNQNNSYKLSVISTVVSAVSVIASLVIALCVR